MFKIRIIRRLHGHAANSIAIQEPKRHSLLNAPCRNLHRLRSAATSVSLANTLRIRALLELLHHKP